MISVTRKVPRTTRGAGIARGMAVWIEFLRVAAMIIIYRKKERLLNTHAHLQSEFIPFQQFYKKVYKE